MAIAITLAGDDVALGNVNLVRFSDDGREAALGYWLVPAARGQGLATTGARMLCKWGFDALRLTRIELSVLPENVASRRVVQRLGAVSEGLRHNSHEVDGLGHDMAIYSLRRPGRPGGISSRAAA